MKFGIKRNGFGLRTADRVVPASDFDFVTALWLPQTRQRAAKVALIVGTFLILINQGDFLLAGIFPPIWKVVLTYLVPYAVSSYSTAAFVVEFSDEPSGRLPSDSERQ